jgi:hypothetical protein
VTRGKVKFKEIIKKIKEGEKKRRKKKEITKG